MHNALSNSIMRKLKLFSASHFSPQRTIWIRKKRMEIVKKSAIHNLPPHAALFLCCHRAAVSRKVSAGSLLKNK